MGGAGARPGLAARQRSGSGGASRTLRADGYGQRGRARPAAPLPRRSRLGGRGRGGRPLSGGSLPGMLQRGADRRLPGLLPLPRRLGHV